ncbi:methionyl-tRNA formyltransferase [Halarcobacter anaerophilus]|uniref:methionyl-tRNA formyltransferase n=1 Tax=Halarcobacter anaerophilus TaxID=877500 RepID=UPI0005CB06BD|nr:methionyl-tRNA formyltransferase [Halarcobacter anaerophilus]
MKSIVIVTIKEWNIKNYFELKAKYEKEFRFFLVTSVEELTYEAIEKIKPKYIFFPHWSWIIPKTIYEKYECVVFHMTDLPFGRGGSPLQNLIVNEIYDTKISAIRVNNELDSGDIYLKEDLNIAIGSAEEIFINASNITFQKIIPQFLKKDLKATPQEGDVTIFKRRKPFQSNLLELDNLTINRVYDFIRMLDAEGYPKAFIPLNSLKIEFSEVHKKGDKVIGRFEVIENE